MQEAVGAAALWLQLRVWPRVAEAAAGPSGTSVCHRTRLLPPSGYNVLLCFVLPNFVQIRLYQISP